MKRQKANFHRLSAITSRVLMYCALVAPIVGTVACAHQLESPDGRIQVQIELSGSGPSSELAYRISLDGETLIDDSTIHFVLDNDVVIGKHLEFVLTSGKETHDSVWKPVYGERSLIRDHYNALTLHFRDVRANCPFTIEFRCYDSGVAFRSTLGSKDSAQRLAVSEEHSEFRLRGDHAAWCAVRAQGEYHEQRLSEIQGPVERPLTIKLDEHLYAAIAEAGLVDYAAMKLRRAERDPNCLVSQLGSPVEAAGQLRTPWRVVLLARSPGELLENNDIILNLNEPCAIADTSWINPGKAIREVTLSTEGAKACIDFAVKHNLQYVEFDAGWYGDEYDDRSDATTVSVDPKRVTGPLDLQAVTEYARQRDVGIILYVNRRALEKQLDELLPLYKAWGIAGVKFGFVNTGSQKWTIWLIEAVRKAAEHELMVDVHDEYRPTGYSRTYPNLMSQEGVRGDEARPTSRQAITSLFTRNLAGAADHTICYFDARVPKNWTHGHQLAKAVCTYSPWQFIYWYDTPLSAAQDTLSLTNRIVDSPELEFFDRIPTVWDETQVIHGAIGEYAVIARRDGQDWFIGAMNGQRERSLEVPFQFLDPGVTYRARIYSDDPNLKTRTQVRIDEKSVDSRTVLNVVFPPNGGQAMWITPANTAIEAVREKRP